jgi:mRNA interferase RelE/StbE
LEIHYRKAFLKDIKRLKRQPVYNKVFELVFMTLPTIKTIRELSDVKSMKGFSNRYRIRIGNYRIGIEMQDDFIEIVRVLHRRKFYRHFP